MRSALPAYLEQPPGMMSFDSESSLCSRELTVHMQDEDSWRSEDAKESPRVERKVVTKVETESDEEQELKSRLGKLGARRYQEA